MRTEWIDFPKLGDERGELSVAESENHIPFGLKRAYWIFGTNKNVRRGFHAHHKLEQVAIAINGSCKMLLDDGEKKTNVILDSPTRGIKVNPLIWHEMFEFTEDCILLVLASDVYDESDYIRDYEEFREYIHTSSI